MLGADGVTYLTDDGLATGNALQLDADPTRLQGVKFEHIPKKQVTSGSCKISPHGLSVAARKWAAGEGKAAQVYDMTYKLLQNMINQGKKLDEGNNFLCVTAKDKATEVNFCLQNLRF